MEPQRVVVIGAGGHGREVLEALVLSGQAVVGFVDDAPGLKGARVLGYPVLGDVDWLLDQPTGRLACVCAIGDNQLRKALVERLAGRLPFASAIHPSAVIFPTARLGQGVMVGAGAIVSSAAEAGDHVILNARASVSHDTVLADYCNLNPASTIAGTVRVGEGAFIGAGATIIQDLNIGPWAVVGAGAVVIRDVPAGATVVGVPAKPLIRTGGGEGT